MKMYSSAFSKAYLLSERDAVDMAIRQLSSEGEITMTQLILILGAWEKIMDNGGKRLTTRQLRNVIRQHAEDK